MFLDYLDLIDFEPVKDFTIPDNIAMLLNIEKNDWKKLYLLWLQHEMTDKWITVRRQQFGFSEFSRERTTLTITNWQKVEEDYPLCCGVEYENTGPTCDKKSILLFYEDVISLKDKECSTASEIFENIRNESILTALWVNFDDEYFIIEEENHYDTAYC